jgi:serine phosphatase RsbU (regulator of sigma subunit)
MHTVFSNSFGQSFELKEDSIKKALSIADYEEANTLIQEIDDHPSSTEGSYWDGVTTYYRGKICYSQLDELNAVALLSRSKEIFIQHDSLSKAMNASESLFQIYYRKQEHDLSKEYCLEALEVAIAAKDSFQLSNWYNHLGNNSVRIEKYDEAIKYERLSLLYANAIGNEKLASYAYSTIGEVYANIEEFDSADYYFNKTLDIKIEYGMNTGWLKSKIGKLSIARGKPDVAIKICEEGLEESYEMQNVRPQMFNCECLNEAYSLVGDYKNAYRALNKLRSLQEETESDTKRNDITRLNYEIKYEKQALSDSIEREKEIQVAKAELDLKDEKLAHEKSVKLYLYLGLGMLVLFIGFIFNRLRVIRRQKLEIAAQKDESEKLRESAEQHRLIAEEKNVEILDSINYAKRIQSAILPPASFIQEHLKESFVLYKPKDIVAGDFYWVKRQHGKTYFAAADCTGHGVPGAMVSVICNNALNRSILEFNLSDPADILNKTRELIADELESGDHEISDGMDIALCSIEDSELKYAGANNPLWILREGEMMITKGDKQPVGKFFKSAPFTSHTLKLLKDDIIYVFSDGYQDQFGGEKGKKYKAKQLLTFMMGISHLPMSEQLKTLDENFENWKGSFEQLDDVCIIGVKV